MKHEAASENVRIRSIFHTLSLFVSFAMLSQFAHGGVGCGTKIVFAKEIGNIQDIYVMDVGSNVATRLTDTPERDNFEPKVSSDCARIVFTSTRDDVSGNDTEVYSMNIDGSNQTRLTNSPGLNEFPNWSPDGSNIVFTSSRDTAASATSTGEIYRMDSAGNNETRLTTDDFDDTSPDWSVNDMIVSSKVLSGLEYSIFVMDASGSAQVKITGGANTYDRSPSWSADGSKIAFERIVAGREVASGIFTMDANGSALNQILANSAAVLNFSARWSAGTDLIYYSNAAGNYDVYSMDQFGNSIEQITTDSLNEYEPHW